jgi:sugar lactone lactonase YvrE
MRNDQSERSGRWLSYGPALGTAWLLAVGTAPYGCGGGNDNGSGSSGPDGGGIHAGNVDAGLEEASAAADAGGKEGNAGDSGARGNGQIGTITQAANDTGFTSPFDATPSPDGSTIFFTAIGADGTGGVFTSPASGGSATRLDSGGVFTSPSGITISGDGKQLFVADPAADDDATDQYGAVFVLPAAGGTPAVLAGTRGLQPRGVVAAGPTLYFTAGGASAAGPGVYSIALVGGQATAIVTGAPLVDPGGVAVAQNGDAYVADSVGSADSLAAIFKVSGGQATLIVGDLGVGYPAGIALAEDESTLLVSGLDPEAQTDVVYRVVLGATPQASRFNQTISAFGEPAGLHRAAGVDVYAWADSLANTTGTVYTLSR